MSEEREKGGIMAALSPSFTTSLVSPSIPYLPFTSVLSLPPSGTGVRECK